MQDTQQQTINKSQRIEYIDALRGFTMLLVVFVHMETFTLDIAPCTTITSSIILSFVMPLFFFISGFFSYKHEYCISEGKRLVKFFFSKVIALVVPTIIIGLAYTYMLTNKTACNFFLNSLKLGYWFTLALPQMFLLLYLICYLTRKQTIKGNNKPWLISLIGISASLYLALSPIRRYDLSWCDITLVTSTCEYFIYFVFGVVISKYKDYFYKTLDNQYITASIITLFCILTWYNFTTTEYNSIIIEKLCSRLIPPILGFLGTTIVFNFFRIYQQNFTQATQMGRALQYVGRRTLDIYLLHYFLIPTLPFWGNIIKESNSMVIEIIMGFCVSIFVVVFCLIISNILRTSKLLEFILFGVKQK